MENYGFLCANKCKNSKILIYLLARHCLAYFFA
nr:MAG TPA: hypothetical protein [Caudoviricetes sp.]